MSILAFDEFPHNCTYFQILKNPLWSRQSSSRWSWNCFRKPQSSGCQYMTLIFTPFGGVYNDRSIMSSWPRKVNVITKRKHDWINTNNNIWYEKKYTRIICATYSPNNNLSIRYVWFGRFYTRRRLWSLVCREFFIPKLTVRNHQNQWRTRFKSKLRNINLCLI